MRFPKTTLLLFFTSLFASLVVANQSESDLQTGKEIYVTKCKSCHGTAGEGVKVIAKAFNVELRHLGSKEVQRKSDARLIKESIGGIGKMKPVKDIPEDRTQNLLAFLRSLAKK